MHQAIKNAQIQWNNEGTPVSDQFDDVYFSNDHGLNETRYVFLDSNNLSQRLLECPRAQFVIGETGFGTGLNFLAAWQAFRQHELQEAGAERLHFISFEKYPLSHADLVKAHSAWPELAELASQLQNSYPLLSAGVHRCEFDNGRVTLDLWLGDIKDCLPELPFSLAGSVDAWFLDGFAPAKNPEMWNQALFDNMARVSRSDATVATFTSAGFVRRGLQQAGFVMKKQKGYGRKRDMLVGQFSVCHLPKVKRPFPFQSSSADTVSIIGGGIASANLAISLLQKGKKVRLFCQDELPAKGASHNRQGAIYPLLIASEPELSHWYMQAFDFALRRYRNACAQVPFPMDFCGVLQTGADEAAHAKLEKIAEAPFVSSVVEWLSAPQVNQKAGVTIDKPGLWYPHGGWLAPQLATRALFELATEMGCEARFGVQVKDISPAGNGWQLAIDGERIACDCVVLANGANLKQFGLSANLPVSRIRGQVSEIPSQGELGQLKCVLCADGYLTPAHDGSHCLGASHSRRFDNLDYSEAEQAQNLQRLHNSYQSQAWIENADVSDNKAKVGVRSSCRDHLPLIGLMPNLDPQAFGSYQSGDGPSWPNLYVLGGFGARGLCTAPLAAEILASEICGEPIPASSETLDRLHPNRFWMRRHLARRPLPQLGMAEPALPPR
ncbi:bifunctional tRNA (5-methylaminomethyl-2-thiouridine)(34)-methyltransferase MnmD/FAD-dependent 5-carboxymethylaminomethyl-2-thiouridine(34) oxidoreductase MnmC [Paraferrimonas sedimenticola]|uniref:bifunctional tRNA (5-methylaminomethyl-2-thiouridine)(34)-methyltransferase MnmD/FAD-dependent 5-carboxymethylaminomethyl-2-thiouridine(34) oxidoreductase MnmC n=1 Tax=Paraferrimonas sedimenticola TaxID=375674 RepID=UPI001B80E25F|nr:bifunctional tRNA (5-methylaminomethyl-2-thiouridine)(34)-methyltransferase MnmD/FAD-dependent 5-carboxymethylaminomethyl-2-thiouridine(34) oxidoreductase MnmC [Paraferrimonas sedimenticola]